MGLHDPNLSEREKENCIGLKVLGAVLGAYGLNVSAAHGEQ
jgi:hypothetical protein